MRYLAAILLIPMTLSAQGRAGAIAGAGSAPAANRAGSNNGTPPPPPPRASAVLGNIIAAQASATAVNNRLFDRNISLPFLHKARQILHAPSAAVRTARSRPDSISL